MALRSDFSPAFNEFSGFLFAPIGEDARGQSVTVLSALARLDLDPETEARRVAALSKEAATQAVAGWIASLPEGSWTTMDARLIAAQLLAALPSRRAMPSASARTAGTPPAPAKPNSMLRWLIYAAFAAMVALAIWNMRGGEDADYMDLSANPSHAPALASHDAGPGATVRLAA